MNKMIFAKSINNRKIFRISEDEFKSYAESGEYIATNFESQYNQLLRSGMEWSVSQAAHLLAREDPEDIRCRPNSGYHTSNDYQKIFYTINQDYMHGSLALKEKFGTEGKNILVAENLVFIRWAIEKGFINIPEIFTEFLKNSVGDKESLPPILDKLYSTDTKNIFIRNGDCYEITFNGTRLKPLNNIKGLQYLSILLKDPHKTHSVNDLYYQCNPMFSDVSITKNELVELQQRHDVALPDILYDHNTSKSLKNKIVDLDEKIEEEKNMGNIEKAEKLEDERSKIIKYLCQGSYKNKSKTFSTDADKRRSTVTQAIKAGIKKIGTYSPELQKHLEDSIKTGIQCVYQPAQITVW